jgi:hypothetical protein
MKQLEIIHLRLAGSLPRELCREIQRSLIAWGEPESVQVYHHGAIETDLAVHLRVRGEGPTGRPSALGIRLADSLREHGMVEHAVWVEDQPSMNRVPK